MDGFRASDRLSGQNSLFVILRDVDYLATDGAGEESEFSKF